ncbi:hemolysin family protein [Patescibacteria group bacterium]|nr:hemolysin family protein [Patescibacteria group bacterium]MBU1015519.1 hemolysin family protein [Patescibacteria group bacterium]MBU1685637.1 hemolysin family protein [Patescibacteria group bacterium]MBU1938130.1 hemolysin family protein [Patescibacteria group bacterium]
MDTDLVLLLILIIISGAFSGAEIALTSLSPAKTKMLKNDHRPGAKAVYRLKQKPERLLITILIGNNLVNILATVVATIWGIKVFGSNALGIVTGALTLIILVFGEITPKTYAQKHAEGFARMMANPLLWFTYILYPIIWLLEKFIHGLMHLMKAKSPIKTMSEEEFLAMVDIGTKEGVIEEHEQEMIENVLEFTDTTVEEIMTTKSNIESLDVNTVIHEARQFFISHSHSRIPVYKGNLDNIVGILTVHDILKITQAEKPIEKLSDFHYLPPIVVPKTKAIAKLFREFQKRRQHIAIVVDERGNTVGLVTLEDILEEIVGDIVDESDQEKSLVTPIGKNEWLATGEATIEEVNEATGIELNYPEHQTVSLLILEKLQNFPRLGERIEYEQLEFQVKKMNKNIIEEVLITKL